MADVIDLMVLAHDKGFQRRVKYAMQKAAVAIMGEAPGLRTEYATKVLNGSASVLELATAVLSDTAVIAAVDAAKALNPDKAVRSRVATEAEIDNAVTARWSAMSGITGP